MFTVSQVDLSPKKVLWYECIRVRLLVYLYSADARIRVKKAALYTFSTFSAGSLAAALVFVTCFQHSYHYWRSHRVDRMMGVLNAI